MAAEFVSAYPSLSRRQKQKERKNPAMSTAGVHFSVMSQGLLVFPASSCGAHLPVPSIKAMLLPVPFPV